MTKIGIIRDELNKYIITLRLKETEYRKLIDQIAYLIFVERNDAYLRGMLKGFEKRKLFDDETEERDMSAFKICEKCGAYLDPNEECDCDKE